MTTLLSGKKIVFLGAGSMAEAIIRGIVGQKVADADHITAVNRSNKDTLNHLQHTYGIRTEQDPGLAAQATSAADIVVLAMKPKDAAKALAGYKGILHEKQLLISVIAGLSIDVIHGLLENDMPVARTMPNTSCAIGQGVTAVSFSDSVASEQKEMALQLFQATGLVTETDEERMHIVTGVSGSGVAYIYYMMEAMIAGGQDGGMTPEEARELTVQTVLGAASMVRETGEDPASLRRKVTSPNGTTQAALEVFDEYQFTDAVRAAIRRCVQRSKELGDMITDNAQVFLTESNK
ncbi:pyrroline-5-carboxylate reductase [Gorillibacterium massiliense]|uniref:pyrroline-5-carboxylate reductase n=1 Tax=Gorillibacterium massiliense TaxID=1280390 RepID=UPI0004B7EA45|nr:pyrroline-5-carboxylate reductase [Gorillibacterium massiliense]